MATEKKKYAFYTSPQLIEGGRYALNIKKLKILCGEVYAFESLKI